MLPGELEGRTMPVSHSPCVQFSGPAGVQLKIAPEPYRRRYDFFAPGFISSYIRSTVLVLECYTEHEVIHSAFKTAPAL